MSALALLILRVGFLLLLWFFIFAIVYALRSDLFGAPVRKFKNDAPGAMRSGASGGGVAAVGSSGLPGAAAAGALAAGAAASASGVHSTAEQSPLITPSGGALPSAARAGSARGSTAGDRAAGDGTTGAVRTGAARTLVITSGKAAGTSIPLEDEFITIGRSPDSTLVIVDEYTSTYHARLARQGREWVLTDLDSTNGTRLAGEKITQSVPVPLNTPVTIGQTTFELRP